MSVPRQLSDAHRTMVRLGVLICAMQTAYACLFIWRSSIVVEGERFFCLFDDALISMRYARHLAEGYGLVWNIGEYVEGYSNLGWTLILTLLHLPGLCPSHTCLLTQLIGIPILWGCVWATLRLCRAARLLPGATLVAVILCATYYNLIYFSLLGMETAALCLVVTLALTGAVHAQRHKEGRIAPFLWLTGGVLLRTDTALMVLWTATWMSVRIERRRWVPLVGVLCVTAALGLQIWWRHSYYGQWMPNTYYLKMTGWPLTERLIAGISNSIFSILTMGLPVILASWALLGRRRLIVSFLLGAFGVSFAFQVYVGGDAWPLNRFLIPTTPALFVVVAAGMHRLAKDFFHPRRHGGRVPLGIMTLLCILGVNGIHWDHATLLAVPQMVPKSAMNVRLWKAIDRIADEEAQIGVAYAGLLPYYSDRTCVDLLGKCEPHVARGVVIPGNRRPGHNKIDFPYILDTYQPDIIVHADMPCIRRQYFPVGVKVDRIEQVFFVRRGSAHVHGGRRLAWDEQELFTPPELNRK